MNHDEAARLLGAYLDGELDLATCVKIEEHMAGCEACQRELEGGKELIETIRDQTPRFEPSPFLKTRIRAALREQGAPAPRPAWRAFLRWELGAAAALLIVLAILYFPAAGGAPELVREAIANHVRSLEVSHLMDVASTDQHTVKPWFAGKLDYSPQVIDLAASGYPLVGGRLDVLDGQTVSALVYQRRKHYINLFVWPGSAAPPTRLYTEDGYHFIGWTRGGMNYAAVSELGIAELRDFVKLIQDQTVDTRPGE